MACYKGIECINFVDDDNCHLSKESCNNCNGTWCIKINCVSILNNYMNIGYGGPQYVCNHYVGICEKSTNCTGSILPLCKGTCRKYLYSCVEGKGCVQDENGTMTKSECESSCKMVNCDLDKGCSYSTSYGDYLTKAECQNGCTKHKCITSNGCILDPTGTEHYAECLKGCVFWGCDTGCTKKTIYGEHEDQDTCNNFCTPWVCGENKCSRLGKGQYPTEDKCNHNCMKHSCKVGEGCVLDKNGEYKGLEECLNSCTLYDYSGTVGCTVTSKGKYSTLQKCIDDNYTYSCINGCKGLHFKGEWVTKGNCINQCTPWKCDKDKGCYKAMDGTGVYRTLEECIDISDCNNDCNSCKAVGRYCLHNGVCWAYNDSDTCHNNGGLWCKKETSWNCSADNGCIEQEGPNATYKTKESCDLECSSWDCISNECIKRHGHKGSFVTKGICESNCGSKEYKCTDKPMFEFHNTTNLNNSSNIINKLSSSNQSENIETSKVHVIDSINISDNSLNILFDHTSKYSLGFVLEDVKLSSSNEPFKKYYFTAYQSRVRQIEEELINNHPDILESYNDTDLNWACNNCNRLNKSLCGPIKDQGWCGTCWVFGTVAVMESYISKTQIENGDNKNYISLSEQYISNVIMGNKEYHDYGHSCCGSIFYKCVNAINSIGITDTDNCPYKFDACSTETNCVKNIDHGDRCIFTPSDEPHCQLTIPNNKRVIKTNNNLSIFDITMTSSVSTNYTEYLTNDHVKKLLHIYGPLVTTSHASYITSPNIVTPISYLDTRYNKLDHQITLVGYSTTSDDRPYWIIRNSWGPTGTDGYLAIEMVQEGPSRIFGEFGAVMAMDYDSNFVNDNTSNVTLQKL